MKAAMKKLVSLEREKIYRDLWHLSWPVMMFMIFQTSLEGGSCFYCCPDDRGRFCR